MRILITNDDGINAPGLKALDKIARDIAGPAGEVWTVAPAFEQSGVAHCISYTHPTMIAELGPRRFAAEGTPADCVMAGIYHVLDGQVPDLVLSGVNRGNNSGENAMYSGTLGGAMEGALQGVKSIALSQFYGPAMAQADNPFDAAEAFGPDIIRKLLDAGHWDDGEHTLFYNVNFPPVLAAEVKGTQVVRQGRRPGTRFSVTSQLSPSGRQFLWARGAKQDTATGPDTDVTANLDGYVSVTPMRADLTAQDRIDAVRAAFA